MNLARKDTHTQSIYLRVILKLIKKHPRPMAAIQYAVLSVTRFSLGASHSVEVTSCARGVPQAFRSSSSTLLKRLCAIDRTRRPRYKRLDARSGAEC